MFFNDSRTISCEYMIQGRTRDHCVLISFHVNQNEVFQIVFGNLQHHSNLVIRAQAYEELSVEKYTHLIKQSKIVVLLYTPRSPLDFSSRNLNSPHFCIIIASKVRIGKQFFSRELTPDIT